jgi:hypothetical protein
MMREVLQRRFTRALKEQEEGAPATDWPDVVLIDGGAGQLSAARDVMTDLGVQDVKLVAIAKGPDRDAGREWFHTDGTAPFQLPPRDPVLYFLQRLRDEAHRCAISTHRAGRSRSIRQSELDEVPGIGAARKRALLNHFGSARGVKMAGLGDLEAAPGISHETARRVYAHFHPGCDGERVVATSGPAEISPGGPERNQAYAEQEQARGFGGAMTIRTSSASCHSDAAFPCPRTILEVDAGDLRHRKGGPGGQRDVYRDRVFDVGAGRHSALVQVGAGADETEGRSVQHDAAAW